MDSPVAVVEFQNLIFILSEILCPTLEEADSIYTSLENGKILMGLLLCLMTIRM